MKVAHIAAFFLVTVGAVNWGLVGLGSLMGGADWNVVHMLLGSWAQIESIVYVLVGLSGLYLAVTHAKSCKECSKM